MRDRERLISVIRTVNRNAVDAWDAVWLNYGADYMQSAAPAGHSIIERLESVACNSTSPHLRELASETLEHLAWFNDAE